LTKGSPVSALFSFPNPVNEVAARLVAGFVVGLCVGAILLQQPWVTAVIAYGFVARVLTGPTLSPLGQLVTRVIVPRLPLESRPVAGPPKRFAQAIGAVLSVCAAVLALGFGYDTASYVLIGMIAFAATLESALAICIGCRIFAGLVRLGIVPAEVCEKCANIWADRSATTPT